MNKRVNNRAVSDIIAALLLIAIAVAAAILLYVFAIGLLGSLGSSGGLQTKEEILMEAYSFPTGSPASLVVTVRNIGSQTENLAGADYFVNGIKTTGSPSFTCSPASAVTPTEPCAITLTVTTTSLISGASYPLKIATPTGGVFSYPVIYGGAA
jgi:flagellin-like protein